MAKLVMTPGPTNVSARVMAAMQRPVINHRSPSFRKLYKDVVEKTKTVFETEGDIVIFTSSGTGAVEASISNLIRPGDNAIVTSFGEFGNRVGEMVEVYGGTTVKASAPLGDCPRIESLEEAFEKTKGVKALYVIYNETSTGVAFRWLKQAGELASKYGAYFIVDAISNLGGDELPVDKLGVDICIAASQKCLAAPPALGIISLSERVKAEMEKNPPKNFYFNIPRYLKFAEKGETPFTPALPLFYALDEALNVALEEGMQNRIARHKRCAESFYSTLGRLGAKSFAKEDVRSNTVISLLYPPGVDDLNFRKTLDEEHDVIIAGGFGEYKGKMFRIGCMGVINEKIVDQTVSAIGKVLGR